MYHKELLLDCLFMFPYILGCVRPRLGFNFVCYSMVPAAHLYHQHMLVMKQELSVE